MAEIAVLIPTSSGRAAPQPTPFGDVHVQAQPVAGRAIALIEPAADPRSGPWAARALGATRLVIVAPAAGLNRLLRPGDWLVPDDFVDQSRGLPTTYFHDRGLGYVQQLPPFCPELRAALAKAPASGAGRVFERGTYLAAPAPRAETPAEARWWQRLGGDVAGWGVFPAAALARELELCVAVACYVTRPGGAADETWLEPGGLSGLAAALATELPQTRGCQCGEAMAGARARGLLEEDWWQTLVPG
jgi:purine nucleoside phosphorylase